MDAVVHALFIERVAKPLVRNEPPNEERIARLVQQRLPAVLSYLNQWLDEHPGPYLVGKQVSIADFAVCNHLVDLDAAKIDWKKSKHPKLQKYYQRMLKHPIFFKGLPTALHPAQH